METETNASANEFKTLKCEYSFDAAKLKDQFIETNSQAFVNYISYPKFLSLIRFRNYCFKDPDLPDVFVTYDDSNPTSMEKNIINVLQNIKPYQSNQSLSDIIVSAYPDSQSAIQYFVYSTFPSIYGFFCCDEYSEQALNFLLLHFDDSLLPKLIGTFLMHSFIFQDRFIHLFFHSLSPKQIDFDEDYISDLFIYTLRRCISCFSRQQIQIVKKLIDTDKEKAKEAIFDEFLIPFISLWDIHPLYASTNIIIRISPPETPNDFISVKISNKLISLLNNMLSKDLCEEVFGAFYTRIYTILPEIQQIIFYGGLDFQFSNADIIISTKLYQSIRKKIDTNTNGNKFFNDAFHMKTFNIAVIPKIRPPDPNEPTKEITINKLQDNKTSREFLLNHSHGLREIQTMVESLKHIMRLFIDHYAMYQMAYREDNYPITFIKTQIENLSLNMLNIFVRTSKNLLEYVEKQTNSEFPNNQLSSIRFVIDGYLQENMPLHEIVVNSAITLQNKWANMYNDDVNNKTRINLSIIKDNSFMNKIILFQ